MKYNWGIISIFSFVMAFGAMESKGGEISDNLPPPEKKSGWLIMEGKVYDGAIEISSNEEKVWIDGDLYIRGIIDQPASLNKLSSGEFTRNDVFALVAESIWEKAQDNQAISDTFILNLEDWAKRYLAQIDNPEVKIEIHDQLDWVDFSSGNPPSVISYKIKPVDKDYYSPNIGPQVKNIKRWIANGSLVAWGEDYLLVFSPEEADHVLSVVVEIITTREPCSNESLTKYGIMEIEGFKFLNSFVNDLCAKGGK